jgi:hypothetical protein
MCRALRIVARLTGMAWGILSPTDVCRLMRFWRQLS